MFIIHPTDVIDRRRSVPSRFSVLMSGATEDRTYVNPRIITHSSVLYRPYKSVISWAFIHHVKPDYHINKTRAQILKASVYTLLFTLVYFPITVL